MTKEELLKDIQFNIEECNKHLNQNPYPPAQKRVGYVMNNKCRALDIPFYLNAIYNEEQIKLNTNIDDRKSRIYSLSSNFTLAEATIDRISLNLIDTVEKTKEKKAKKYKKSLFGLGRKTGLGSTEEVWIPVVSAGSFNEEEYLYSENFSFSDAMLWKETVNESYQMQTTNLQEALREYNARKFKKKDNYITYDAIDENQRYCSYHTYHFDGYINITTFIMNQLEKIINDEYKRNATSKSENQLYDWELYSWEVFVDNKSVASYYSKVEQEEEENDYVDGYVPPESLVPEWKQGYIVFKTTDILDKMNQTKSDTSQMDRILDQNKDIHKLIDEFDEKYFNPYYKEWSDYSKKENGSDFSNIEKQTKAFNKCKDLMDKMFDVVLQYKDDAPLNSDLAEYINKYENYSKTYSVNQQRKEEIAVEDTQSHKKLRNLWAQRQQILNSGNAKLQEYFKNKQEQYANEVADSVIQLREAVEYNKKKQEEFVYFLDSQKLRYNGLQTAFKEHLQNILAINQQKAIQLDRQFQQNLFKDSDIKIRIDVKFIPDGIPQSFYMQQLDKGFVYEDLQKKIDELIEEQNKKKQNQNQQRKLERELIDIRQQKKKMEDANAILDAMIPSQIEKISQIEAARAQAIQSIPYTEDYQQKQSWYSTVNSYFDEQREEIQNNINSLNSQKKANEQQINILTNRENGLNEACKSNSDPTSLTVQTTELNNELYKKQKELQTKLDVLNIHIQETAAAQATQTQLNQNVMITNSQYIKMRNECAPYFEYQRQYEAARDMNDEEGMTQAEENMRAWSKGHSQSLDLLNKYETDLEKEKNDYINNLNTVKKNKEFLDSKKSIQKQLAETDAQIAQIEAPQVGTQLIQSGDGGLYKQGYSFSTNGLYKNIYIDVQEENEWLVLRQNLKDLYSYYNFNLPEGQIEEPGTTKEELQDAFSIAVGPATEAFKLIHNPKEGTCNWFLPLDFELFGPGVELPLKLTTNVYKTDDYGEKIPKYNKQNQITGYMSQKRQMGVMNGTGYIFTGQRITLYYTGLPGPEGISVFISGVGMEYGTLMAGGYVAATPYNIYLLRKYPYGNHNPLSSFYWLQCGALADGAAAVMGKMPIEVTFKIYKKIPLPCGYPKKCGVLKPEEYANRGVCGLRVFFETTYDLTTEFDENSFDINTYMEIVQGNDLFGGDASTGFLAKAKEAAIEGARGAMGDAVKRVSSNLLSNLNNLSRTFDTAAEKAIKVYEKNFGPVGGRAAQFLQAKRNIAQWGNTSYTLASNTWNVRDAVDNIGNARKVATEQAQAVMNKMRSELFDLIPPECREVICDSIRKSRQDSIKDLGMSINESTKINVDTLNTFMKRTVTDNLKDLGEKAGSVWDGIKNTSNFIGDAFNNFISQFDFWSLTQYCPRRLSDITKDINPFRQSPSAIPGSDGLVEFPEQPSVFNQLNYMIGDQIIGNVMGALNNCITRSITTNNINYSSLFPEGTRKYLAAANTIGDIANMARGMGSYKMSLEDLFHEANRSSILANFADIDTGNISLGYLTDFLDERGISEIIDVNQWLNSSETIVNLKNTIGRAVSNNNDIMKKLANGEVLSMNDQYKQLAGQNLLDKTADWAKLNSDRVNAVTGIGQSAKGLLNTDFSKVWKDPHVVTNKLQNISNIMNSMMMKERAKKKEEEKEMLQAFSTSDEVLQMKYYATQRWQYLEKITGKQFTEQKSRIDKLSINV